MKEREYKGRVEGLSIPDEDVRGWLQTLIEGGFTDHEIDAILSHNNYKYLDAKIGNQVDARFEAGVQEIEKTLNRQMTAAEKDKYRKLLEQHFKPKL
jgi:hypothetical protein